MHLEWTQIARRDGTTHVGKSNIKHCRRQNDVLFVCASVCVYVQKVGSGWWEARNSHGQVGLVPQSYFEVLRLSCFRLPHCRRPVIALLWRRSVNLYIDSTVLVT